MTRRGLQFVLRILGAVAVVFGSLTVFLGSDSVLGGGPVSPTIDSELRFYAAWYAAAGVVLLRAAPRVEAAGGTIRGFGAVLFICGVARLLSLITVGTPHPISVALMVLEFVIPAVIVPWQAAVARRTT
ncbi:MAG TPA: DUF4345 domain-containing protein [Actinomycetota bacterium]|nr:DUF4345 domain-containing protein [Actinomycetota bacterium]